MERRQNNKEKYPIWNNALNDESYIRYPFKLKYN